MRRTKTYDYVTDVRFNNLYMVLHVHKHLTDALNGFCSANDERRSIFELV